MAERRKPATRVLSWWFVTFLVVVLLAAAAGYVYLIGFYLAPGDPTRAAVTETIGTAMLIALLLGGVVGLLLVARALILAERRQRFRELSEPEEREHAERVRVHAERLESVQRRERDQADREGHAAGVEYRLGERLGGAVNQLGSDRPAVRLGALAMLEQVAEAHPEQRQTVVDIVAGYLRLPPDGPGDSAPDRSEKVVRRAAQRLITRHLGTADRRRQWRGLRIDLSGAVLVDFDAAGCVLPEVDFGGASFWGATCFDDCVFEQAPGFRGAKFGGGRVDFRRTGFASPTVFERVTFGCPVDFGASSWADSAGFERVLFDSEVGFDGARFTGSVEVRDADFGGQTSFRQVAFGGDILLVDAVFRDAVTFADATCEGHSWFSEVRAVRSVPHTFPPGYRQVVLDASWVRLEHLEAVEPVANDPAAAPMPVAGIPPAEGSPTPAAVATPTASAPPATPATSPAAGASPSGGSDAPNEPHQSVDAG